MIIQPIPPNSPTFGYSNQLKTLWRKGKLPSVTTGIYGGKLTKHSVSLEHLECYCFTHDSRISNLALATKENNSKRGNKDIRDYLTAEKAKKYLEQFIDVAVDGFNGNEYIKLIKKTLSKLGVFC